MCPNIFGECLLGPSASQFHHKQKKIYCVIRNDTAPPTPALDDQLLSSQNKILASIIFHILKDKMVVWLDCCVNVFR